MNLFFVSLVVWAVILAGLAIGGWMLRRRQQRRIAGTVTPRWLVQHMYDREGDRL